MVGLSWFHLQCHATIVGTFNSCWVLLSFEDREAIFWEMKLLPDMISVSVDKWVLFTSSVVIAIKCFAVIMCLTARSHCVRVRARACVITVFGEWHITCLTLAHTKTYTNRLFSSAWWFVIMKICLDILLEELELFLLCTSWLTWRAGSRDEDAMSICSWFFILALRWLKQWHL